MSLGKQVALALLCAPFLLAAAFLKAPVLRNPFYKSAQCTYLEWPVMK